MSLPDAVGEGVAVDCGTEAECFVYGDFGNLTVSDINDGNCARVEWTSTYARRLEDCYNVGPGQYMYGGSG